MVIAKHFKTNSFVRSCYMSHYAKHKNDCKTCSGIGDLYSLWKIIYIKCFNPILIIGAGVSGLTIASGIKNQNFLILEARERIGGRVFTNDENILLMQDDT